MSSESSNSASRRPRASSKLTDSENKIKQLLFDSRRKYKDEIPSGDNKVLADLQNAMAEECQPEMLDTYIHSIITQNFTEEKEGKFYDSLGISRNTSIIASDPHFVGLRCNKCKAPNSSSQDAYKHHTKCYDTCENGCGARITLVREDDLHEMVFAGIDLIDTSKQQAHNLECIMLCKKRIYYQDGSHKTCNHRFEDWRDFVKHVNTCQQQDNKNNKNKRTK